MSSQRNQTAVADESTSLRSVIESLWPDDPSKQDLKLSMLSKFDSFVRAHKNAHGKFETYRKRNTIWIVSIIVVASLLPASAILPEAGTWLSGERLKPEQVTGILGIVLSGLIATYQGLGIRSQVNGFNEMGNQYKGLRDRIALTVRDQEAFETLLAENHLLRMRWNDVVPAPDVALPN